MKKGIIYFGILIFLISVAYAHQPRVGEDQGTAENPIHIEKPEISKAYYRELKGEQEYFELTSDKDFLLYVNILAPDIQSARTDFKVEILKDNENIALLEGGEWESWYEPFGGDSYLMGPEFEESVQAGTYTLIVSNPDNQGKYSLAVGKIESFPPLEILRTIIALPGVKRWFGKSVLTSYFNLVGLFMLIILLILAGIIFLTVWIVRKYRKKKKNKK